MTSITDPEEIGKWLDQNPTYFASYFIKKVLQQIFSTILTHYSSRVISGRHYAHQPMAHRTRLRYLVRGQHWEKVSSSAGTTLWASWISFDMLLATRFGRFLPHIRHTLAHQPPRTRVRLPLHHHDDNHHPRQHLRRWSQQWWDFVTIWHAPRNSPSTYVDAQDFLPYLPKNKWKLSRGPFERRKDPAYPSVD